MSALKEIERFVCTIFEALGKLVETLHRHPNGAMAFVTILALVVADVPLIAVLRSQVAPVQNMQSENTQTARPVAHGDAAAVRRPARASNV